MDIGGYIMKTSFKKRFLKDIRWNWILYMMIIPVIIYYIIFSYIPMYGVTIAFKDYTTKGGILGSEWVGLAHFKRFFGAYNFWSLLKNTLILSTYTMLVAFPAPIILAIILHYSTKPFLKKTVQMLSYAPNFLSTVVVCCMIRLLLGEENGAVNGVIELLGGESINFLGKAKLFKHIYAWSGVWQGTGWSAIIYIAALAGVDPEIHEAATIDGATILQRIRHVDIPALKPTIVMLLIMNVPSLISVGFEKVYLLQTKLNLTAANVLSTYVYSQGLIQADYSYSAAVGLFNTIISIILLLSANTFCKRVLNESMF